MKIYLAINFWKSIHVENIFIFFLPKNLFCNINKLTVRILFYGKIDN